MEWISVNDRLPEPEQRILVCAESRCGDKTHKHITVAMYEDGNIWYNESGLIFNDIDVYGTYDDDQGDWRVPEGWWEYTIYNDGANLQIGDLVTYWMPLPEPPKED